MFAGGPPSAATGESSWQRVDLAAAARRRRRCETLETAECRRIRQAAAREGTGDLARVLAARELNAKFAADPRPRVVVVGLTAKGGEVSVSRHHLAAGAPFDPAVPSASAACRVPAEETIGEAEDRAAAAAAAAAEAEAEHLRRMRQLYSPPTPAGGMLAQPEHSAPGQPPPPPGQHTRVHGARAIARGVSSGAGRGHRKNEYHIDYTPRTPAPRAATAPRPASVRRVAAVAPRSTPGRAKQLDRRGGRPGAKAGPGVQHASQGAGSTLPLIPPPPRTPPAIRRAHTGGGAAISG